MVFFHTISEGYGTQCFENIFPQKMPLYVINFLRLSEPPKPYHLFFSPHFRVQHEAQCSVLKNLLIAIFKISTFMALSLNLIKMESTALMISKQWLNHTRVIYQGVLTRKLLEERDFQFAYVLMFS